MVTSFGARGLVVLHIEAPSKPVWVPKPASSKFHLCPAVGLAKPCTPGGGSGRSRPRPGLSRLRRSKIENLPLLSLAGGVGVGAVGLRARRRRCGCWWSPGARPAIARLGRVGDVDDHQLAATGVGVLDVARAGRLVEVDADEREAADLAVGVGALAAVHRLVLELEATGVRRSARAGSARRRRRPGPSRGWTARTAAWSSGSTRRCPPRTGCSRPGRRCCWRSAGCSGRC